MSAELLRPGLLDGVRMLLAGAGDSDALLAAQACRELGASVASVELELEAPAEGHASEATGHALADLGPAHPAHPAHPADLVLIDAGSMFAAAGAGPDGLARGMHACWEVCRTAGEQSLLPAGSGLVVLLAPRPDAGVHADGARAGLENLARTLSIEWARFGVRALAVAPGTQTPAQDVGRLVAYLASPAGAYFSGCLLDLRGPA